MEREKKEREETEWEKNVTGYVKRKEKKRKEKGGKERGDVCTKQVGGVRT